MEHTPPPPRGDSGEADDRHQGTSGAYRELRKLQKEERRVRYNQAVAEVVKGIEEFGVHTALTKAMVHQAYGPLHTLVDGIAVPTQHGPYPGAGWPGSGGLLPPPEPEEVELWVVWSGDNTDLTAYRTEVEALRAALAVAAPSTVVPVQYGERMMEAVGAHRVAEARKQRAAEAVARETREAARNEMTRAHEQNKQEREQ